MSASPRPPSPGPAVELLRLSPDFVADPYPVYAALRAQGPVHRVLTPLGEDQWIVVGHEACRAAYVDPRFSRDWRTHGHLAPQLPAYAHGPGNAHVLLRDPPDHTRMRRLVTREFTPRRVAALAPRVQQIADELIDAMEAGGARTADVIDSLAFPLPMTVICDLLGVPDLDRDAFRGWSNEVVAPTSPEAEQAAYAAAMPYLGGLIEDKRKAPGEDLLSALIHTADEEGDRLNEDELLSMAFLLIVAGHETTVNLIGNGLRALFNHPEQLALLRADLPGLIDGAVEEALRYDGPVEGSTPRIAREDVDFEGVRIPAGSSVVIVMADADRDESRFGDAGRFDIRRDARGHIAFGHGIHFCIGAPLARLEGRIAIRTLLERFPELAPTESPDAGPWIPGLLIRGVRKLPVRW
ncbi:cytochrome P450 family protein [Streptomyces candidus]|uniref:Cytochrome P450 n=1 Tax=Streptomyces candidus TaxID=67283 RepID=A0A7X0HA37_9ACTN|nr:cytochrome P450 [Streptomyces candidus]MBB6433691.1 cytochrome P450 [Streptomyces candidus]GHH34946.1 cytochrome P450 hydroxylase [Streptomyces candidus]